MSRPSAAFDIDGTVIRWQLYHGIASTLAKQGKLGPDAYERLRQARQAWKQRSGTESFASYEKLVVELFDAAVTSISYDYFLRVVQEVFDEHKDQTYTYTRDMIKRLKAEGYLVFAISASQVEAVKLFADYFGCDDYAGSSYEVEDGVFTGKKDIIKREKKAECFQALIAKHGSSLSGSIAVGDSESDIPLLSLAENPLAFNPTRGLYRHAKAARWKIVIERKNVQYELEPHDGSYLLA